jgi:hypothetical protein
MHSPKTLSPTGRTKALGSLNFEPIIEGVSPNPSLEPIVTVYPTEYVRTFHLCVFVFAPTGLTPKMDDDFTRVELVTTPAGTFSARQLKVVYGASSSTTYSLWKMETDYSVEEGHEAPAIRVYLQIGDPIASRGTITTVSNT